MKDITMIPDSEMHGNPADVYRAIAREMSLVVDETAMGIWQQECSDRNDYVDMRGYGPSTVYGYLEAVAQAGTMHVAFVDSCWTVLKERPRLTA
jgi:hypothetical protein